MTQICISTVPPHPQPRWIEYTRLSVLLLHSSRGPSWIEYDSRQEAAAMLTKGTTQQRRQPYMCQVPLSLDWWCGFGFERLVLVGKSETSPNLESAKPNQLEGSWI